MDMEISLLAAILHDRFTQAKVVDEGFRPDLLETPAVQTTATVLLLLREEGVATIDPLILRSRLEERGELTTEVAALVDATARISPPPLDQVMAYLEVLKDRASRRRLRTLGTSLQDYAQHEGPGRAPVSEFTANALQELLEIQRQRMRRRLVPISEVVHQIAKESERRKGRVLLGYSISPFNRLNETLSGLRRGFYYGIAGAPRRGKTNLTLHLASAIAVNNDIPVLFITWEQTQMVLTARLMAKESGLSPTTILSDDVTRRRGGTEQLAKALNGTRAYARHVYIVEGSREHTLDRIRAMVYNLMHEFRTDSIAIFLDYLQKIPLPKWNSDARARIDEVSTGLADLSLELQCPIVAISSIDKEGCRLDDEPTGEDAGNELLVRPRPTMHNCTGAGDIEYDLDVAMILAKDWRTTTQLSQLLANRRDLMDPPKIDVINLYIDKNRDAPEEGGSVIQFAFLINQNRFVELRYKTEEEDSPEYHGFAMIQEIYNTLVASGDLPGSEVGRPTAVF
jgi:replicative DNA helicase